MPLYDPWKSGDYPIPPVRAATPIQVFRYNGPGNFTALPNIVCLGIETSEGPDPGQAMFRYVMDSRFGGPFAIEQALGTQYTGNLIVEPGQRICVLATRADGVSQWIFDGYPMGFGGKIDGRTEGAAIQAIGIAKRAFDKPIGGQLMRNADLPYTGDEVQTAIPVQFNPKGMENATPEGGDAFSGAARFPVFLDPLLPIPKPTVPPAPDPPVRIQRKWTLPMAVSYLQQTNNADQVYVKNMATADLDRILVAYEPIPSMAIDPDNQNTYTKSDIAAADVPLTHERWPTAVRKLTEDYGFGMRWRLTTTSDGNPETRLQLWWNQAGPVKSIYLAERGSDFDAARNNVGAAELDRDISSVVNQVVAEGGLIRYEATFVLSCGFPCHASDAADVAAMSVYKEGDRAYATSDNFDAYRLYVFDETGEGHYLCNTFDKLTTVASLDGLLGAGKYVNRRRKPIGELITKDANGKPLPWRMAISKDYTGPSPALWDGTGTWRHCESGAALLRDRIGIRISIDDPNKWRIGDVLLSGSTQPFPGGVIHGVECQALNNTENPKFWLQLTCVIEGDQVSESTAPRAAWSPLPWDIEERIDARDRFGKLVIGPQSEFNLTGSEVVKHDDKDYLKAEALAVREAKEAGVFEANITIPYFTTAYQIGDRIDRIEGRNLGFRTDGGGSGSMPVYPQVVGVRWDFADGQHTLLQLSDKGLNHRQVRRRRTNASKHAIAMQAAKAHPTAGFIKGSGKPNNGIADYVGPSERDNA